MMIHLKIVTRENWEEAIKLEVNSEQLNFVPTVAVSLAKVYIKPDGENVEYIPFAIYDDQTMVGFIMHAFEEHTTNSYWINGFLIDKQFQSKGYGKLAFVEMIKWIGNKFQQCKEIRLTVHKDNKLAMNLYKQLGFIPTGNYFGEEEVWYYIVQR
ncbi:GNAT family N-acetyltransferase [Bacillus sp. AFS055030]|uniref:GNAT family N-acetyltransferase n=1 Tax=Bacillus sp. AFS055030 TaxID=2033507 RepID=UPI000BFCEB35|nr:GNAT family N-acetyltransferase [Bacillus sp. AFS055030]PGL71145.1 GNAT family N-acetyltransferase [Bacillus sp. AFS055030]